MERKVPVLRSDNSLIEQEFDSIRDKFELEMRKMEEEMSRFRSQLIASERSRLVSSLTSSSSAASSMSSMQQSSSKSAASLRPATNLQTTKKSTVTTTSTTSSQQTSNKPAPVELEQLQQAQAGDWLEELNSPLITTDESSGDKLLKLRFDVTPYEPEQIIVKTIDNRLQIHAKREERNENSSMYREYNREFLLPQGTNPELIRSSLSADGVLTVEAPLPTGQAGGHSPIEWQA